MDSFELNKLDAEHVWHPFTPMSVHCREQPPVIASADGFYLTDTCGKRYLDGISSLWCNVHGHRVPELDQAVIDQLQKVAHTTLLGNSSPPSIELAAALVEKLPAELKYVFYSDAGSTAVEAALKMAVQYHSQKVSGPEKRTTFVRLAESYHGDTIGSVSVGRIEHFHRHFGPLLFDVITLPTPAGYHLPAGHDAATWQQHCLDTLQKTLAENADHIAAVIIEPLVQGAAGILVHPVGFLKRVRELTTAHGILLIADEVAVGFGKTGTLFACEQEQVCPDLICLAKGISGGYLPLAATVARTEIYEAFLGEPVAGKTFFHGHTYTGNALACAVGLASLKRFETHRVLEQTRHSEQYLADRLQEWMDHPQIGQIRKKGIMVGIELVADRESRTPYPADLRMGHQVVLAARERGLIIRPLGDVVVLMPAVAMPEPQLEELCDKTFAAIEQVCQQKVRN